MRAVRHSEMRIHRTAGQGLRSSVALALFLAASGLLFALPTGRAARSAPPDAATVIVVYDGDTVKVKFKDGAERRVRLIGIDSPELGDERESVRFMAQVAKRFAFLKLYRREVGLSYDRQLEDKYGRLLAFLTTEDGTLFNELILREGFAFKLLAFPFKPELMKRFEAAESEARRGEKGSVEERGPGAGRPGGGGASARPAGLGHDGLRFGPEAEAVHGPSPGRRRDRGPRPRKAVGRFSGPRGAGRQAHRRPGPRRRVPRPPPDHG